jgi:peroxiredoxin Q/BCP
MRSILSGLVCLMLATLTRQDGAIAGERLKVGDPAPDFSLPAASKDSIFSAPVSLADYRGQSNVILAFYPADWSGGCTKEMCTMRDNFGDLGTLGAVVLGISGDYVNSHREWAKHLGLQFLLLSDHNHDVARTYDSYNAPSGHDMRTVYVIGKNGRIIYIDREYVAGSQKSFEHLREALKSLH